MAKKQYENILNEKDSLTDILTGEKELVKLYGAALTETLAEGADYEKTFPLAGIDGPQRVELGAHRTRTLTLDRLIKCDNPSAFPALRQIDCLLYTSQSPRDA